MRLSTVPPSHPGRTVASWNRSPASQWRDRAGFSPASLLTPASMRQDGSIIFAGAPETGNLIQFKQASILVSDYTLFTHTKQYKPWKVPLPECWFLAHQCDQQHAHQLLSTNTINSLSASIVLTSDQPLSTIASSRLPCVESTSFPSISPGNTPRRLALDGVGHPDHLIWRKHRFQLLRNNKHILPAPSIEGEYMVAFLRRQTEQCL